MTGRSSVDPLVLVLGMAGVTLGLVAVASNPSAPMWAKIGAAVLWLLFAGVFAAKYRTARRV